MSHSDTPILNQIDFDIEAQLDPTIQFPHPVTERALNPRDVFLTGATGFLGAYLLSDLLQQTDATVHCLARASNDAAALERVIRQLRSYGLWQDSFADRINGVAGDLEKPYLGLSPERFRDLAVRMDAIFHSAGWINMAFPYQRLKPTNVFGTQEVLRFAGAESTKPVHFVSSIAVFYSDAHGHTGVVNETDTPRFHLSLKGGYSKSKWVADRLVAAAQARGLPTTTYRPVRIMGHSKTGANNDMSDILPLLLKGCIVAGKFPTLDIKITLVPVDYVSRAMVHLAGTQAAWGRAFHLFNHAPIEWRRLMSTINRLGYPMTELPYDQWWQEIKQRTRQDSDEPGENKQLLATLLLALTAPHFLFYKRPPLDDRLTQEGLAGTDIVCPPISQELIARYIGYWQENGYLQQPRRLAHAL